MRSIKTLLQLMLDHQDDTAMGYGMCVQIYCLFIDHRIDSIEYERLKNHIWNNKPDSLYSPNRFFPEGDVLSRVHFINNLIEQCE